MKNLEINKYIRERLCPKFQVLAKEHKLVYQRIVGDLKITLAVAHYGVDQIKLDVDTFCVKCNKNETKVMYEYNYHTSTNPIKAYPIIDKAIEDVCNKQSCEADCIFKHP